MPKMKTKKALAKRISVTKNGKVKRGSSYRSHLAASKTAKQKRQLRPGGLLDKTDYKRLKGLIEIIGH